MFAGFDCCQRLVESDVDVVLLASPPYFRPHQMELAIEAGKHVFCEKPVAVDAPGVRRVRASCELAEQKRLSVVSGLCWRYDVAVNAVIDRIRDGALGDIRMIQENYLTGTLWHRGNDPSWSRMEYQLRNWLYFNWLSGDHITEQHIHSLDKALWVMDDEPPISAYGQGGRQVRTGEKWGNVYDHFSTVYQWKNGVKMFSYCRQVPDCFNDTEDYVVGTEATAHVLRNEILANTQVIWKYQGDNPSMYDVEHQQLFRSIREGKPINNGSYMCDSTLVAIMGREASYTGQVIKWDEIKNSDQRLGPERLEWSDYEPDPVAKPGGDAW
jgi:predicted dehydrogenase